MGVYFEISILDEQQSFTPELKNRINKIANDRVASVWCCIENILLRTANYLQLGR